MTNYAYFMAHNVKVELWAHFKVLHYSTWKKSIYIIIAKCCDPVKVI